MDSNAIGKMIRATNAGILHVKSEKSRSIAVSYTNGRIRRRKDVPRQGRKQRCRGGPVSIASIFLFVDQVPNFLR